MNMQHAFVSEQLMSWLLRLQQFDCKSDLKRKRGYHIYPMALVSFFINVSFMGSLSLLD